MWSKYTGVLIWKNQNPWTGLRGQFYDHLHDQTAGFYGCRSAAEPIHVQLNLATYVIEVYSAILELIGWLFSILVFRLVLKKQTISEKQKYVFIISRTSSPKT